MLHLVVVEVVEHLGIGELRRSPVGVAVKDGVTEICALIAQLVETDREGVWRVDIENWRSQPVAVDLRGQGAEIRVEDAGARVDGRAGGCVGACVDGCVGDCTQSYDDCQKGECQKFLHRLDFTRRWAWRHVPEDRRWRARSDDCRRIRGERTEGRGGER